MAELFNFFLRFSDAFFGLKNTSTDLALVQKDWDFQHVGRSTFTFFKLTNRWRSYFFLRFSDAFFGLKNASTDLALVQKDWDFSMSAGQLRLVGKSHSVVDKQRNHQKSIHASYARSHGRIELKANESDINIKCRLTTNKC